MPGTPVFMRVPDFFRFRGSLRGGIEFSIPGPLVASAYENEAFMHTPFFEKDKEGEPLKSVPLLLIIFNGYFTPVQMVHRSRRIPH